MATKTKRTAMDPNFRWGHGLCCKPNLETLPVLESMATCPLFPAKAMERRFAGSRLSLHKHHGSVSPMHIGVHGHKKPRSTKAPELRSQGQVPPAGQAAPPEPPRGVRQNMRQTKIPNPATYPARRSRA